MNSVKRSWNSARVIPALCAIFGCCIPALAEPALSTPLLLPGDQTLAQPAGRQETPQISRGSNGYLVVWADNRSSLRGTGTSGPYFGDGLGTMMDVYAARLDASGNLIDTTPISISQAQYNQTVPRVGWNGQNWLVVWMTEREGNRYQLDLVGVRVSPGGTVLDATPIVIKSAGQSSADHRPWSVACDGTNWVVAWQALDSTGSVWIIAGARVGPDGTVLDPSGKTLRQDTWNSGANKAALAFAGDEYLMTWVELDSGTAGFVVRGQRLTPALDPIGGVFKINLYSPSSAERPSVATDGTGFLVAWDEERYYGYSQLFGSRVSHTGSVLDPNGIQITGASGYTMFQPTVAWDGGNYVVAYNIDKNFGDEDIYVTRVSSAGTVLDPNGKPVRTGPGNQNSASVTRAISTGVQVAWNDTSAVTTSNFNGGDVQTASATAAGTAGSTVDVSLGAPRQSFPRFAYSGPDHLVVFKSEVSGENRILAQRLDANGAPIDLEPIRLAAGPSLTNPAVAWNGSNYMIVWENAGEAGHGQIYARRLTASGTILDPAPIPVMRGQMPDVGALGSNYLIVATDWESNSHFRATFAVRVGTNGAVLGARVPIGAYFDVWPRVVGFGNRWLAVWEQNVSHDSAQSSIVGAFVGANGVSQGQFVISDGGNDDRPDLAVGGDTALVAWEGGDIFGRRIRSDGTLLDTPRGIVISGAPEKQFRASVAWDGTDWVVAYLDHRNDPYPNQERGDIFATRVGADGSVLDPNGFAVAATAAPEETPAVTAASGLTLFGYSAFVSQAPYANLRMTVSTTNAVSVLGEAPGMILAKSPNGIAIDLTWNACCRAGADYAVYEGSLGAWSSHMPTLCSTGGQTSATVSPVAGDRYFVVVPNDATTEGIYGADSTGTERPASTSACRTSRNASACP